MGLVTLEAIAAKRAEVERLRAEFPLPPPPQPGDSPLARMDSALHIDRLHKIAVTPHGIEWRRREDELAALEALRVRQLAALDRHEAAEKVMAPRVGEMATELEASRQRLTRACNKGSVVDVGNAATAHDGLVRAFARELRDGGLHSEVEGVEFDTGGLPESATSGVKLAGRSWHSCDSFTVTLWWSCGQMASLYGADHPYLMAARDRYLLGNFDRRPDGLLADVRLPKPGATRSPWAAWVKRPNITDPMIVGDPLAALDRRRAEIDTTVPVGERAFAHAQVRQQTQIVQAELAAAKGA